MKIKEVYFTFCAYKTKRQRQRIKCFLFFSMHHTGGAHLDFLKSHRFLMFACWWWKTQSPVLFLLFSIFKKGLKCIVWFQFCSSGRVNKGHCRQSSVPLGEGQKGEGLPLLPSGLGWAGAAQCWTNLPGTDLQLPGAWRQP